MIKKSWIDFDLYAYELWTVNVNYHTLDGENVFGTVYKVDYNLFAHFTLGSSQTLKGPQKLSYL